MLYRKFVVIFWMLHGAISYYIFVDVLLNVLGGILLDAVFGLLAVIFISLCCIIIY